LSKSLANNRNPPSATLWLADASCFSDQELAFFVRCLGPSEADRYRRFARTGRQRQFLVGRMLLRFAVGDAMAMPPSAIAILEQADRAPRLVLPASAGMLPGFSLSHSGEWVACAVSRDTLLGLDIEILNRNRDLLAISQSAFHTEEAELLEKLHGESRVVAFYHLWSLREALFKLRSNTGSADRFPGLLDEENAIASSGKGWQSHVFDIPGFSCILCSTCHLSLPPLPKPREISPLALLAAMTPDYAGPAAPTEQ
jgi:4'-phosphopantetheinyl transferase